jgi:hypothetical protein
VVVVSLALIAAILTYFLDWPTLVSEPMVRRQRVAQPKDDDVERRYTGSIIIPTGEGLCWRYILDNRTGNLRYGGHPRCVEATRQLDTKKTRESIDRSRLREVGKAFRHESD